MKSKHSWKFPVTIKGSWKPKEEDKTKQEDLKKWQQKK